MRNQNDLAQRADGVAFANMRRELAALGAMTVGELAEKYREVFGAPTRSRNKAYLHSHIAWRIQERAEGGLSPRALEQIEQLAPQAPARWRPPVGQRKAAAAATDNVGPDPRLPPVGATITRRHGRVEHRVTVLADGFEYRGEYYRSLSKIACLITGKSWNGYVFFFGRGVDAGRGVSVGDAAQAGAR